MFLQTAAQEVLISQRRNLEHFHTSGSESDPDLRGVVDPAFA
jgi:hypothetical protein